MAREEEKILRKFSFLLDPEDNITNVFNEIKEYFTRNELYFNIIDSICTDSSSAMLVNRSCFSALMRKEIHNLKITHCFLHRHALAARTLP